MNLIKTALSCALLAIAPAVLADDAYPTKPIRVIVPFGAGGITDVVARVLTDGMQREFGKAFVVENATGAAGMIGATKVAKAAPDGYTILFTTNVHTITPAVRQKIPYDTLKDFTALALVGYAPNILVVSATAPYQTVKDYIAAAKADVGAMSYASAGLGTTPHLAAEQFAQMTGITYIHVPFTTTTAMAQSVLAGDVKSTWIPAQPAEQFLKTGKLKALGVASRERSRYAPDVPTFEELGFKNFSSEAWFALMGPANLPPEITRRLISTAQKVLSRSDVQEKLQAAGIDRLKPAYGAEFKDLMVKEVDAYKTLVRTTKIPLLD